MYQKCGGAFLHIGTEQAERVQSCSPDHSKKRNHLRVVPFFVTGLEDEKEVRAHSAAPRIAGFLCIRNAEEHFCTLAQSKRSEFNPVVPTIL